MLATAAIVVVADGNSAVIYKNIGHDSIILELVEAVSPPSMAAEGQQGHAPVEQSPNDAQEATFVGHLVHKLNAMALANKLPDEVAIVADPSSLGHMRPLYHAELKKRIVTELSKTLVKASPLDVAAALTKG